MEIAEQHRTEHLNGEQNTSIDRLGNLPDPILSHILSFLPTKLSVTTSVLARRWRFLWAYVSNFDLCCLTSVLPLRLFTFKTLVNLRLESCGVIPMEAPVCLPCLKKLRLSSVQYEADESLQHLISRCPVLEELDIESFNELISCIISSPTIKRLNVFFDSEDMGYQHYHILEIDTPALTHLKIVDHTSHHIKSGKLHFLIEADIYHNVYHIRDESHYSRSILEFIDSLSYVKCLKLMGCYWKIVDSEISAWKTTSFYNLTNLELADHIRFLSKFLENADNLEFLFLKGVVYARGWKEPQQVPRCLISHLRIIRLAVSIRSRYDREIVWYLLRNGKVLKRIEIADDPLFSDFEMRNDIYQQISSDICEVVLVKVLKGD